MAYATLQDTPQHHNTSSGTQLLIMPAPQKPAGTHYAMLLWEGRDRPPEVLFRGPHGTGSTEALMGVVVHTLVHL